MKVTDGKRTIEVTEKAYRVVYAAKGFKPVEAQQEDESKKTKRGK